MQRDHEHIEQEGRLGVLGFDAFVDNKSQDSEYENDSEYLLAPDFLSYD